MRALSIAAIGLLAACSAPTASEPSAQSTAALVSPVETAAPPAPSAVEVVPEPTQEPAQAAPPPVWKQAHAIESNGAAYVVHVSPAPDLLPDNEPFQLEVWVARAAEPDVLARDVELSVAAAMPEHGHGMNRVPKVSKRDDGSFLVDGMLFHMTGHWELYLDVTRGAVTERAQCDIVLE
jgi:hypothetical protein